MGQNDIRVLIVEESHDDLLTFSRHLKEYREPVEVTSVRTAEEAINRLRTNRYDLCLMGLNLPGMDGVELFRYIQEHGDNLPTIIVTTGGDEKKAVKITKLGAYDYLLKHEITPSLLNKSICHAIEEHKSKKEKERLQEELESYAKRLEEIVKKRTEEVEYLNNYKELVLGSLDEYVRVIDPENKVVQYESRKIVEEFGNGVGQRCYYLWNRDKECEECISLKAIEEWDKKSKEEVNGDKVYNVTAIPLRNMDGSILAVEVIRDITEQRKTEEKLKQKERLAAMGEMSAHLAHEIRNPLNKVTINYHILTESPDIRGEDRKWLGYIGDGLEAILAIATDLLDYSRSDRLNIESCDPVKMISDVLSELEKKIDGRGIKVVKELRKEPVLLSADKVKINRVLMNVVDNAVQAMPEGGTLTVSAEKEDGGFCIRVSDTGCGMSKETLDQIFVPFYTTKKEGTGLGLPIVKNFVDLHGGKIEVDSEEGEGTTVTVIFPLQTDSS